MAIGRNMTKMSIKRNLWNRILSRIPIKKKLHELLSFLSDATTLPRTRNVDP